MTHAQQIAVDRDELVSLEGMQAAAPARPLTSSRALRRIRRLLLAVFTSQYVLVAICVGLSVAGTLQYFVSPQIVGKFEAIAAALKRWR